MAAEHIANIVQGIKITRHSPYLTETKIHLSELGEEYIGALCEALGEEGIRYAIEDLNVVVVLREADQQERERRSRSRFFRRHFGDN